MGVGRRIVDRRSDIKILFHSYQSKKRGSLGQLLVEAVNASVGGNEALLAGIEGMAVRAGVDLDFLQGATGFEGVAAGSADDLATMVFGMDAFFHSLTPFALRSVCRKESPGVIIRGTT